MECLNSSAVERRDNALNEFNEVLMNQVNVNMFDRIDHLDDLNLFAELDPEQELKRIEMEHESQKIQMDPDHVWRGLEEMAGCQYGFAPPESANYFKEALPTVSLQSQSSYEPSSEASPAQSSEPSSVLSSPPPMNGEQPKFHSICIQSNGRSKVHRPKCNQDNESRKPKTIQSLAARSRMPKRSKHKKRRIIDGVHPQIVTMDRQKEQRSENVSKLQTYRVIVYEQQPFKLTFVPIK